jgi:hypothetical protein
VLFYEAMGTFGSDLDGSARRNRAGGQGVNVSCLKGPAGSAGRAGCLVLEPAARKRTANRRELWIARQKASS